MSSPMTMLMMGSATCQPMVMTRTEEMTTPDGTEQVGHDVLGRHPRR